VLGLIFLYQEKRLAWKISPVLCPVGRKTTTQSINLSWMQLLFLKNKRAW